VRLRVDALAAAAVQFAPMTAPSPDQLVPGSVLADRYEIIRRLGSGGMGAVYLARHQLMDRLCALKVLPPGQHRDAEALERFTREARNASRIIHPNVCTVFDFGTTSDGVAYLSMEYLEGRTLGAILAESSRMPLDRAVRLAREMAAGLDAAHGLGIVHRDLKPDNVMVIPGRTGETVKLVDFGIAKALEAEPAKGVTAPGVVIGTPDYMSPEQFAGDPVDPRADVYALGVIFYRMVTGSLPHQGETARETLTKRLTEPPRPLGDAAPDLVVPAGLQSILNRVLARRPEERYPTAGAFADAVIGLLTGPLEIGFAPTVRLDTATAPITVATPVPKRRMVVPALTGLGIGAAVLAMVLLKPGGAAPEGPAGNSLEPQPVDTAPAQGPDVAPLSRPDTSSNRPRATDPVRRTEPAATTGTTLVPPAAPPPAPTEPAPLPDLPTTDAISDPATRGASRARAEQITERVDASYGYRADAALLVALAYLEDERPDLARRWVLRAQAFNDLAPADTARARRTRTINRQLSTLNRTPTDTTS